MTHEDSRRILTSMPYKDGEIKIIVAKDRCELGNHYHKIKTENSLKFNPELSLTKGNYSKIKPNKQDQLDIKIDERIKKD